MRNRTHENYYQILCIRISLASNFHLKQAVLIFGQNLPKKGIFGPK